MDFNTCITFAGFLLPSSPESIQRPLLGNDREIRNYTTAVTRQLPVSSNGFSTRPFPRCYKQDKLGAELSELAGEI
jgi:hypothetical protein